MAANKKTDQRMVGLRNVSWNIFCTCKLIDSHPSMMGALRSITRNVSQL